MDFYLTVYPHFEAYLSRALTSSSPMPIGIGKEEPKEGRNAMDNSAKVVEV
jgi:hypothetical protein